MDSESLSDAFCGIVRLLSNMISQIRNALNNPSLSRIPWPCNELAETMNFPSLKWNSQASLESLSSTLSQYSAFEALQNHSGFPGLDSIRRTLQFELAALPNSNFLGFPQAFGKGTSTSSTNSAKGKMIIFSCL